MIRTGRYYVKAVVVGNEIKGYKVCQSLGGITADYNTYEIHKDQSWEVALELANQERDDRNKEID